MAFRGVSAIEQEAWGRPMSAWHGMRDPLTQEG